MSNRVSPPLTACAILGMSAALVAFVGCRQQELITEDSPTEEVAELVRPSDADVIAAVEQYVQNEIASKGGFEVEDPRSGETLMLSLDSVHGSVHKEFASDHYYVCVDLSDAGGNVYDVDVHMVGPGDDLVPIRALLHKVNGEAIGE